MSAPQTNLEKQKKRHRGPLAGIALGIVVVGVMFLVWLIWLSDNGQTPREATPEGGVIGNSAPEEPLVTDEVVPGADVQN